MHLRAGGSNDKSCAICRSAFGNILNRKHKCRVSLFGPNPRFVLDQRGEQLGTLSEKAEKLMKASSEKKV